VNAAISMLQSSAEFSGEDLGINSTCSGLTLAQLLEAISVYYSVIKVKAQLDQLIEGLQALGVYELLSSHSKLVTDTFCNKVDLTTELIIDLFDVLYSPEESSRSKEEVVITFWIELLTLIDCKP
jgi:hypothetical protein